MRKVFIIILTLIILLGVGWYFYAKSHQTQPGVPSITDFSAFFPLGNDGDPSIIDGVLPSNNIDQTGAANSPFKRISAGAVAGYSSFQQKSTITLPADILIPKSKPTQQTVNKHLVRYIARSNGFVYEIEGEELPLQITNIYIPNIYEAIFGDGSSTAILRFLRNDDRTIATFSIPIPELNPDSTRTQKPGVYFPDNITSMAVSPDGKQLARITNETNGALLRLSSSTNTKNVDIIRTPFSEWILSWPSNNTLYLQTKPSARVPGYLYKISTSEKKLHRIIGAVEGLTASISPSGTYVIYSQYSANGFITRILNTKTTTTKTLSLALLPEKCTWLSNEDLICAGNSSVPEAEYPDDWYKGLVTFSDQVYRVYTANSVYDTIYDNTTHSFDMISLSADEENGKLYFIDKPTGFLWEMKY